MRIAGVNGVSRVSYVLIAFSVFLFVGAYSQTASGQGGGGVNPPYHTGVGHPYYYWDGDWSSWTLKQTSSSNGGPFVTDTVVDQVTDGAGNDLGTVTVNASYTGGPSATLTNPAPGWFLIEGTHTIQDQGIEMSPDESGLYEGGTVEFREARYWAADFRVGRWETDEDGYAVLHTWQVNGVDWMSTTKVKQIYNVIYQHP